MYGNNRNYQRMGQGMQRGMKQMGQGVQRGMKQMGQGMRRMGRRMRPETKKGYAIYIIILLLIIGGVVGFGFYTEWTFKIPKKEVTVSPTPPVSTPPTSTPPTSTPPTSTPPTSTPPTSTPPTSTPPTSTKTCKDFIEENDCPTTCEWLSNTGCIPKNPTCSDIPDSIDCGAYDQSGKCEWLPKTGCIPKNPDCSDIPDSTDCGAYDQSGKCEWLPKTGCIPKNPDCSDIPDSTDCGAYDQSGKCEWLPKTGCIPKNPDCSDIHHSTDCNDYDSSTKCDWGDNKCLPKIANCSSLTTEDDCDIYTSSKSCLWESGKCNENLCITDPRSTENCKDGYYGENCLQPLVYSDDIDWGKIKLGNKDCNKDNWEAWGTTGAKSPSQFKEDTMNFTNKQSIYCTDDINQTEKDMNDLCEDWKTPTTLSDANKQNFLCNNKCYKKNSNKTIDNYIIQSGKIYPELLKNFECLNNQTQNCPLEFGGIKSYRESLDNQNCTYTDVTYRLGNNFSGNDVSGVDTGNDIPAGYYSDGLYSDYYVTVPTSDGDDSDGTYKKIAQDRCNLYKNCIGIEKNKNVNSGKFQYLLKRKKGQDTSKTDTTSFLKDENCKISSCKQLCNSIEGCKSFTTKKEFPAPDLSKIQTICVGKNKNNSGNVKFHSDNANIGGTTSPVGDTCDAAIYFKAFNDESQDGTICFCVDTKDSYSYIRVGEKGCKDAVLNTDGTTKTGSCGGFGYTTLFKFWAYTEPRIGTVPFSIKLLKQNTKGSWIKSTIIEGDNGGGKVFYAYPESYSKSEITPLSCSLNYTDSFMYDASSTSFKRIIMDPYPPTCLCPLDAVMSKGNVFYFFKGPFYKEYNNATKILSETKKITGTWTSSDSDSDWVNAVSEGFDAAIYFESWPTSSTINNTGSINFFKGNNYWTFQASSDNSYFGKGTINGGKNDENTWWGQKDTTTGCRRGEFKCAGYSGGCCPTCNVSTGQLRDSMGRCECVKDSTKDTEKCPTGWECTSGSCTRKASNIPDPTKLNKYGNVGISNGWDAITTDEKKINYYFKGNKYWNTIDGSPKSIQTEWGSSLPDMAEQGGWDAVVFAGSSTYYFFKGGLYWKRVSNSVVTGPKKINETFEGVCTTCTDEIKNDEFIQNCDQPCPSGEYCYNGTCVCGTTGKGCPSGEYCYNGTCVCGTTGKGCPSGEYCYNGTCVCGTTGSTCPSGKTCKNSKCE